MHCCYYFISSNLTIIGIIFFVHSTGAFHFTLSSLSFLSMSVPILIYYLFPSLFSPFFILFSFLFRAPPPYSLSLYRKTCLLTVNFSPERNTKPVSKLLQSLPGCLACLSVCLTDWLTGCIPACLPVCLKACLSDCLSSFPLAFQPAYLPCQSQ